MNKLILCVGISGAGKTTFCNENCDPDFSVVICPDKLRAIIGSGESDQTVNGAVFATVFRMVEYLLQHSNRDVVVDATNYSVKNRKELITIARKVGCFTDAWLFPVPVNIAIQRNNQRDRVVPCDVIERQFTNMSWPLPTEVDSYRFIDPDGFVRGVNFSHLTGEENDFIQTQIKQIDKGLKPISTFFANLSFALQPDLKYN